MKRNKLTALAAGVLVLLSACKKDGNNPAPEEEKPKEGRFVICALPYMSYLTGMGTDLLYTTNTLDSGSLVMEGKGIEQDGRSRNYLAHNNVFLSLLFGQTSQGAVTAYGLSTDGALQRKSTFQTETMTARGIVGDDIVMFKNAWEPTQEYTPWYRLSTKSLEIVGRGEINTNTLSGNGEMALFTTARKVGDKVFAPFLSMKNGRGFETSFRDSSWIAVFSYPDMQLEKVIRDNRTGAIGAYFTDAVEVDENGDFYAIGASLGMSGSQGSTKPVAIMKIKKGTTEYDQSYFFNISEASGGNFVFRKLYLGKGNFLLMMSETKTLYATGAKKFAIANVYDKTFKWVTGLPAASQIMQISEYSNNYSPLDGKTGYFAMTSVNDKEEAVTGIYKVDATTATGSLGLKVGSAANINIVTSVNWITLEP